MTLVIGVVAGLAIGLTLGAMGGGGAIITVPVLVYLMGQSPTEATTGSLVVVGVAAAVSVVAHHGAGQVRWAQGLTFAVVGTVGTFVGARLSAHVDPDVLLLSFALLLLVVAALMLRRMRAGASASPDGPPVGPHDGPPVGPHDGPHDGLPDGPRDGPRDGSARVSNDGLEWDGEVPARLGPALDWTRVVRVVVTAVGVGALTGFFGVGGGFAVVPALVIALGFSMRAATGTSLLVIALNSATALASRLGAGIALDWPVLIVLTVAAVTGSLVGARVAARVPQALLAKVFTALLVAVALYAGVGSLQALTRR